MRRLVDSRAGGGCSRNVHSIVSSARLFSSACWFISFNIQLVSFGMLACFLQRASLFLENACFLEQKYEV